VGGVNTCNLGYTVRGGFDKIDGGEGERFREVAWGDRQLKLDRPGEESGGR